MAKLLVRSKSVKLSQNKKECSQDESQKEPNLRTTKSPNLQSPMAAFVESPVDPSLLSQTAKFTFLTNPSSSSLTLARPKTAGETGAKKDWSSMLRTGSPIEISTEHDTFHFPTPLRRPSTANSVTSTPRLDGKPIVNMSPDAGIGLSVGSPAERVPQKSKSNLSIVKKNSDNTSKASGPVRSQTTRESSTQDDSQAKLSRWKSLGGLFTRRTGPTGSLKEAHATTSPKVEQRSKSAMSQRKKGEISGGSPTPPISSPPQPLWKRATRRKYKPGVPEDGSAQLPPQGPSLLDVSIPEGQMERYSVLFQGVKTLPARPTRSSSLLARRQATAAGNSLKARSPNLLCLHRNLTRTQDLDIHPGLVRRATEPSPSTASPSYMLFPNPSNQANIRLPHISQALRRNPTQISTVNRPRPVKRHNTSPSNLRSPALVLTPMQQPKLSPAFEVDELAPSRPPTQDSDHQGLTPTPSSVGSPSTPKSITASPPHRKHSWASSHGDAAWEMITVKKRYSPGDLFTASTTNVPSTMHGATIPLQSTFSAAPIQSSTPGPENSTKPASKGDDDDWFADAPEVVVARTVSVTRANSQRKLFVRPVRGSSRAVTAAATPVTIASPASTTGSSVAAYSVASSIMTSRSTSSADTSVTSGSAGIERSVELDDETKRARLEQKKMDLKKEIWGDSRDVVEIERDGRWDEHRAMTPRMCVVEEDSRKSVWGVIESV
jgi:hypothetical protein